MWLGWLVGVRAELWGRAGQVQAEARARLVLRSLLLHCKALLPTFRPSSHVLGALTPQKPMGNPRLAALLLPLIGLSASAGIGCSYLPCWSTRCLLASRMVRCACRCRVESPDWRRLVMLPSLLPVLSYHPRPCALMAASLCSLHCIKGVTKVLVH